MAAQVSVVVTTVSGDDTLRFSGTGQLTRDDRGTPLDYTAAGEDSSLLRSQLHLGLGRAVVHSSDYRLLLDPGRTTQAQLTTDGGTLPLTVETHRVHADLVGDAGTITLHYTLLAQGRPLQTLRVTLALTPNDKERTQ